MICLLVLPTNAATYELEAPLLLVVTVPQLDLTLAGTLIRKECYWNIRSLLAARQFRLVIYQTTGSQPCIHGYILLLWLVSYSSYTLQFIHLIATHEKAAR
jgi:hypothetical protein